MVGESWVSSATHYKGFDQFGSVTFHLGAEPLVAALKGSAFELTYMTAHDAVEKFPFEMARARRLRRDHPVRHRGEFLPPAARRVAAVANRPEPAAAHQGLGGTGGGLLMCGGYFSFQGIDGKARWRKTPVEDVLPVTCHPWDDRVEMPEGAVAEIVEPAHPVLKGLEGAWPFVLGVNEVEPKDTGLVLARLPADQGGHPLLVLGGHGKGRTAAWTSDIGPHWLSPAFCAWPGYGRLWKNLLGWLAHEGTDDR